MIRVTPVVGHNKRVVCLFDGILGLFDSHDKPIASIEIAIMLVCGIPATPDGMVPALIVREITANDFLVHHGGFERVGNNTRAMLSVQSDTTLKRECRRGLGWISPGRTPVMMVDNTTTRPNNRHIPVPGLAYVSRQDIRDGHQRVSGVPSLDYMDKMFVRSLLRRKEI